MDWVKAIAIIMVCTSIQMFFLRLNGTLKTYTNLIGNLIGLAGWGLAIYILVSESLINAS